MKRKTKQYSAEQHSIIMKSELSGSNGYSKDSPLKELTPDMCSVWGWNLTLKGISESEYEKPPSDCDVRRRCFFQASLSDRLHPRICQTGYARQTESRCRAHPSHIGRDVGCNEIFMLLFLSGRQAKPPESSDPAVMCVWQDLLFFRRRLRYFADAARNSSKPEMLSSVYQSNAPIFLRIHVTCISYSISS